MYRFIPVDHTVHTWAVFDRVTKLKLTDEKDEVVEYRDSMAARQASESYNLDPSLVDNENSDKDQDDPS